MEPTPHDDRPRTPRGNDARLSEALGWLVRLNRFRASEAEVVALQVWCARSAAHAQAWREAVALWRLLLPAACAVPSRQRQQPPRGSACRPRIAGTAGDIRLDTSDTSSSSHFRSRQSWS